MMKKNMWFTIKNQSLAVSVRNAGFDLAIFDQYTRSVQTELKKRASKEAVRGIAVAVSEEHKFNLADVKQGVYVIGLARPLAISYLNGWSPVIYIGMGDIITRISNHFGVSLFDFMQSLSGANFDFHFAVPTLKKQAQYYKHVEFEMLEHFNEKFGSFPLLNSRAGAKKNVLVVRDWWKKPMKIAGARPLWTLSPTKNSPFTHLD